MSLWKIRHLIRGSLSNAFDDWSFPKLKLAWFRLSNQDKKSRSSSWRAVLDLRSMDISNLVWPTSGSALFVTLAVARHHSYCIFKILKSLQAVLSGHSLGRQGCMPGAVFP